MLSQHILVIDPDNAFATMLKESLEQAQTCQVVTANDGQTARDALTRDHFTMVILDLGLSDPPAAEMVHWLRAQQPLVPLIVIPLDGDTVPPEIGDLGVQGVLTKPFFLPNLPDLVARAMEAQTTARPTPRLEAEKHSPSSSVPPPQAQPGSVTQWAHSETELTARLSELVRELNADTALLTCGNELVTHAGRFTRQEAEQLGQVIVESWHASSKVAQLLGREKVRFEQATHESKDYLLYSLSVTEDTVLTVALNTSTPLGIIRYHTKQVAEAIARLANSG